MVDQFAGQKTRISRHFHAAIMLSRPWKDFCPAPEAQYREPILETKASLAHHTSEYGVRR
jgi:hypothetical protein